MAKKALGRGLKALIPDVPTARGGYAEIEISRLRANPNQPRDTFDDEALETLAASIREHGILQPLLVSDEGSGTFKILAGERRFRAAGKAGLERLPVVIRERVDEEQSLEIALVENLQRRDLTPMEEARAYQSLRADSGLTQAQIAEKVGFDRSTIANALRLLKLPEEVQALVETGAISAGHARTLLSFPGADTQVAWARTVVRDGLSVRELERAATRSVDETGTPPRTKKVREKDPNTRAAEKRLSLKLGAKIDIKKGKAGGRIVVTCTTDDDFLRVYDHLLGEE